MPLPLLAKANNIISKDMRSLENSLNCTVSIIYLHLNAVTMSNTILIKSPLWKRLLCVRTRIITQCLTINQQKPRWRLKNFTECAERHNSLQSFPQVQCINLPPFLWLSNTLEPPHNFEGQPLSVVRNASWNVQSPSPQRSLKPPLTVRLLRVKLEHLHVLVGMLKSPSKQGSYRLQQKRGPAVPTIKHGCLYVFTEIKHVVNKQYLKQTIKKKNTIPFRPN